jgi:VanZ family protein
MRSLWRWLPLVAWSAMILMAADDTFSAQQSGGWFRALFGRDLPYVLHVLLRKLAHLVEYALLGALAMWARRSYAVALPWALAIALLDEGRQSLSPTRTGSGWDVLLDLAGAAIGATFVPAMRALLSSRRRAG